MISKRTESPTRFAANTAGNIGMIFGLSIFMLMGSAGLALDHSFALMRKTRLQNATDAAALAAARLMDAEKQERKEHGELIFEANLGEIEGIDFKIKVKDNDSIVEATGKETVQTFIMGLFGVPELNISSSAEVPIVKSGFSEVTLVLDYSDSMIDNNKYVRMYEAAAKMIDVISNQGKNKNVKFGLVPFSAVVRADIPTQYLRSDVTFDGCTMDRQYPYNVQEEPTTGSDPEKWGDHSVGDHDCNNVAAAGLKVLPLTEDMDAVKAQLAGFKPHLWTHIALGSEFGWQVISPDGVFGNARPYDDDKNVKAVIILTDGMQTTPGWGAGESRTVENAEANFKDICEGMKSQGINVFTIGYDLTDTHTLNLLETCANPGNYYASTDIENGLLTILSSISKNIQEKMVRLVN